MKLGLRALRGVLVVSLLASVPVPFVAGAAHAVAPSGVPTLLSPDGSGPVSGNPTFSWTAVPGAAKYRVQVSTGDTFASTVYTSDTVNLHATPITPLPVDKPLYWRVAAMDSASALGQYATGSFTRQWADRPVLKSPEHNATLNYPDDPPLFTWDPLAGSQSYEILIDDDPNFVEAPAPTKTVNTSYTLTAPQSNGQTFYWKVRGVASPEYTEWSEVRSYQVAWPEAPVLRTPAYGATVTDAVFSWDPVKGAASYLLEVSPNPDFTNNLTISEVVKGTSYAQPEGLQNGSYFWRVRARDLKTAPNTNLGPWSEEIQAEPGVFLPAQFTRAWSAAPTLLEPANRDDIAVAVPTLRWTPLPHASQYEIWLGTDSQFSPETYVTCLTNHTSYTPYDLWASSEPNAPTPCNLKGTYPRIGTTMYWKVRGVDTYGTYSVNTAITSAFSSTFKFLYEPEDVPYMIAPLGGAVAAPTLSWTPVQGVGRYLVTVQTNGNDITGSPFTTYATSFTPTGLVADKTYTWWVQSYDDEERGGMMPTAEGLGAFTYKPLPEPGTVLEPLTPLDGEAALRMPSMSWTQVKDAKNYQVSVVNLGNGNESWIGTTTSTAFTSSAPPLDSGTYGWRVRAFATDGTVLGVSDLRTFTVDALATATGLLPAKCNQDEPCVATAETPRLSWNPVDGAGGYIVTLSTDAGFSTTVRQFETQFTSLTPRGSLLDTATDKPYYWFVRPCRFAEDGIGCGAGPDDPLVHHLASTFRKRSLAVQPVAPADGATVPAAGATGPQDITFSWNDFAATNYASDPVSSQGARRYKIQVYNNPGLTGTAIDSQEVDQTSYTPHDKTYPEGPLYWRVAAIDGSNNVLTYSPVRSVIKATPPLVPLHPGAGDTVSGTPYFRWTPQAHAGKYELEVYGNGDTAYSPVNAVKPAGGLTSTSAGAATEVTAFAPTSTLAPGAYAWRVRRMDDGNRPGPWSSGGVFTLTAAKPQPESPQDGEVIATDELLFTWSAAPRAAFYKFEASLTPAFSGTAHDSATTVMTSWAPIKRYADGTVYWRVHALDAAKKTVATSETFTIVRDATAPKVTAKAPTSSAPISGGSFTATFSEPVTGVSATTFTMRVASSATPVPGTVTAPTPTTAKFVPAAPLLPGETYTLAVSDGIADVNGNALVPLSWTTRTALSVDSALPVVQQYWDRDTSSLASGGGYLASRTKGSKVSYTFTGTSASVLGRRTTDGGYADVYLDGVKVATASFYASSTQNKVTVWSKTGLANAKHTVELRVAGTKPASATSTWVYPDAFRHGATTLEETSTAVTQAHQTVALAGALGGSYLLGTHTVTGDTGTQPYVTMKFKGTGVAWKGIRGTGGGIAKVYVDNVYKATVDTYGAASTAGTTLWSGSGLTNTTHTVKIVMTGTRRSTSKGYNVTVDSFTVS